VNHIDQTYSPSAPRPAVDALEGQVALRITARLSRGAEDLPHDISERLRFARERAVAAAQHRRRAETAAVVAAPVVVSAGRSAALGGPPSVWLRMVSALPLVMLLAGLVLIQHHHEAEQIAAAADIDTALLADELPPDAYRDPGFVEYLRGTEAP
jgi:nucleotide-binding universal stress UspA family protein